MPYAMRVAGLLAVSAVVGWLRLYHPGRDLTGGWGAYEALAHIWVGWLLAVVFRPTVLDIAADDDEPGRPWTACRIEVEDFRARVYQARWVAGGALLAITAVEVAMFIIYRRPQLPL